MKTKSILTLLATIFFVSSCGSKNLNGSSESSASNSSSGTNTQQTTGSSSTGGTSTGKVTVPAHTLKDTNPPINVNSMGERVSEATWNSFKNGSASKFNGNYNYTYTAIVGMQLAAREKFTKNGYHMLSSSGELFYERKSGSTFYNYVNLSGEYQRFETSLDLQDKYTSRITNEIYVHMFDYNLYEYDDYDGTYWYYTTSFAAAVRFQGGYLTYLHYGMGASAIYDIEATFETTIDIPASYYMK